MATTHTDERRSGGLSLPLKLLLFVGFPLLFLAMLAAAAFAAVPLLSGSSVTLDYRAPAASSVQVNVPNARLDFVPTDGPDVTVHLTGSYTGSRPALQVSTVGDETRVQGGCTPQWLRICSIRVQGALPADADLSGPGENGAISVQGINGTIDVGTTNGRIELTKISGPVTATTTNGAVDLSQSSSDRVTARTTNGAVNLDLTAPPSAIEAHSTNGGIGIRLPDD